MAYLELTPDQIVAPEHSMREELDVDAFRALVATIKAVGLLHPVLVKPSGEKWEIVAGERRWRACIEAGVTVIPAIEKDLGKVGTAMAQAIENLHREDTNPLDDAALFARMTDEDGLSVEEIAQLINMSTAFVANRLALLRAPADVREALRANRITYTVARELMRCPWDADRNWLLHHAMDRAPSADTVRRWVTDVANRHALIPDAPAPTEGSAPPEVPTVLMGACEIHRGEVPLDEIITLRACGRCYQRLTLRQGTTTEVPIAEAPAPQPAASAVPQWRVTFVLESDPTNPSQIVLEAADELAARDLLADGMAKEYLGQRWILLSVEAVTV